MVPTALPWWASFCFYTFGKSLHSGRKFSLFHPVCPQCGRAFDPNFLFLWPNARVSLTAPGHAGSLLSLDDDDEEEEKKQVETLNKRLEEESSAFFSSGRMWDDGVILPQDTRKVKLIFLINSIKLFWRSFLKQLFYFYFFPCRFSETPWKSSNSSGISPLQRNTNQFLYECRNFSPVSGEGA